MKLVTRWTKAAHASYYWEYHYVYQTRFGDGRQPRDILKQLKALGENPHPDEVDKIIINPDGPWTLHPCMECNQMREQVIVFGDEDMEESGNYDIAICAQCLLKAMQLIEP